MKKVLVTKVEASANDHIFLKVSGVSSDYQAERAAFKATGLLEGPVCTGGIDENEDGTFSVHLVGEFDTSAFYKGQNL